MQHMQRCEQVDHICIVSNRNLEAVENTLKRQGM